MGCNNETVDVTKTPFCVIGASVNANSGRTWVATQAEAEAHAGKLLLKNSRGENSPTELFVVQAVAMVRLPMQHEVVKIETPKTAA